MSDTSREDAEPGKEAPRTVLKGLWCTTASQNTTQDNTECNSHYVNKMYIVNVIATCDSHYLAAFWEEEVQTVLLPQITGWSPVLPVAKCSVSPNSRAPGEGTWAPKCPWGHTVSIIELKDRDIPHNLLYFQQLPLPTCMVVHNWKKVSDKIQDASLFPKFPSLLVQTHCSSTKQNRRMKANSKALKNSFVGVNWKPRLQVLDPHNVF